METVLQRLMEDGYKILRSIQDLSLAVHIVSFFCKLGNDGAA
jgi:hypothetical protein